MQRNQWRVILQSKFQELACRQISKLLVALVTFLLENIDKSLAIIKEPLNSICDFIFTPSTTLDCTIKVNTESFISVRVPKLALLMWYLVNVFDIE